MQPGYYGQTCPPSWGTSTMGMPYSGMPFMGMPFSGGFPFTGMPFYGSYPFMDMSSFGGYPFTPSMGMQHFGGYPFMPSMGMQNWGSYPFTPFMGTPYYGGQQFTPFMGTPYSGGQQFAPSMGTPYYGSYPFTGMPSWGGYPFTPFTGTPYAGGQQFAPFSGTAMGNSPYQQTMGPGGFAPSPGTFDCPTCGYCGPQQAGFTPTYNPAGAWGGYPHWAGFGGLGGLRRHGGAYSPQFTATGLPTDEEITEMIYDGMDIDPLIPYDADININCDAGVVTLNGTVPNKRAKHAAGDDAWWVPGVVDVRNEIQIGGRRRARSAPKETEDRKH